MVYKIGDIISFTYGSKKATDAKPIVLVITPMYEGCVHGINLKNLPEREREMLLRITHPTYSSKVGDWVKKLPALQQVLNKRQNQDLQSLGSYSFYTRYVSGFANRWNCYRKYKPQFMTDIIKVDLDKFKT